MPRKNTFTIFDKMEADGAFASNPANNYSPEFRGPVEFPKMLYHPKGELEVFVKGEHIQTLVGPQLVNEQKRLKFLIVNNEKEETALLKEGWHKHPALADKAANRTPAQVASPQRQDELREAIARMSAELKQAEELARIDAPSANVSNEGIGAKTTGVVANGPGKPANVLLGGAKPPVLPGSGVAALE